MIRVLTLLCTAFVLAACEATVTPQNRESGRDGTAYQAQYRNDVSKNQIAFTSSEELNAMLCAPHPDPITIGHHPIVDRDVLSPGDLIRVFVEDDETFTGSYVVGRDGRLALPFTDPVLAQGRTPEHVADHIANELLRLDFYAATPRVSVIITDFASARVFVAGAVFLPGSISVGGSNAQTRDQLRQEALGAATFSRTISNALRNAGGVRPDADLANVIIHRGNRHIKVDMRPAMEGRAFNDLLLVAGDRIEVPSRKCFQEDLVKPSPITTPGVKVFMSNLTIPADSNSESAVGDQARELRYGTRFIQAVVGMNCFGGTKLVNANRRAVLFSRNPHTGESIVIERSIENLLRRSDRDEYDPFIMPEDALACYDSTLIDIADLARAFGIIGALVYLDNN